MTKPTGPVTGLTAVPSAMRPGLAPASYTSNLFRTHARNKGNVRAMESDMVRQSTPASKRA
jgi:hypothetical protein